MSLFAYFALGLAAAFLCWVVCGLIRGNVARALLRAFSLALTATPTIAAGHGVAVVPAWFLFTEAWWHPFAWIPIGVVFLVGAALLLWIRPLRESRTTWPLDAGKILLDPTYPKSFLFGVLSLLAFAAGYEPISDYWPLQIATLLAGVLANYAICSYAARRFQRRGWLLPFMFAAPIAASAILVYALVWWLAGVAGQQVAARKPWRALGLAAATCAVFSFLAAERTVTAWKAREMTHVSIQGGVAGNAGLGLAALVLTVVFLVLVFRVRGRSSATS